MRLSPCPCTSGKAYKACCEPYLNRSITAKTVKQLMRSRYSAFAKGGYGDYLFETWHPDYSTGLAATSLSVKIRNWQGLTILDCRQQGDEGVVQFEARFIDDEGKPGLHREVSRFVRVKGKWLYLNAKQDAEIA